MTISRTELGGQQVYSLSGVRSMPGLNAVRGFVAEATGVQPVDGSVILGDVRGQPHTEIVFQTPIPLEVIERAEAIGALATPRLAERQLR